MPSRFVLFALLFFSLGVRAQEAPGTWVREGVPDTGRVSGWWHGIKRVLRYRPEGTDFVIEKGSRRFNRALYGTNTGFRVEAGDLPEFALYMPGMGGNFQLELVAGALRRPLREATGIKAVYRPGEMLYEIKDSLLGAGVLQVAVLALASGEGMLVRVSGEAISAGIRLGYTFGGASGKKFPRDGDLGEDPASSFDLRAEDCKGDVYRVDGDRWFLTYGQGKELAGVFPQGSGLHIDPLPVVRGEIELGKQMYFLIENPATTTVKDAALLWKEAEAAREKLAGRVVVSTPDPYINTLGGALAVAADAIWEAPSYLHGAVAWRMRLPGWRGPYVADPLGWHDRADQHFSSYALSQVLSPDSGVVVADTALHLARQLEKMGTSLFSSGYISRNPGGNIRPHHYDMNLLYIDALLDHFEWAGDTAMVRRFWPLLVRHLAWEKRNFDVDGDGLYDAYCCIWASDALEYGGGGVTHSSALNYRANKEAARLARIIGEDAGPYEREAAHILKALNERLWLKDKGTFGEYIDWGRTAGGRGDADGAAGVRLGAAGAQAVPAEGTAGVHASPGIWTIYHAIDAGVCDVLQAAQMLAYVDREIPHIPVRAVGLKDSGLFVVSTTSWQPYSWSTNNVALAESLHMALAYWQGGRPETAFQLWKGALVESMYLGGSPGNFQQLSFYDAMRGELYRDFADGIGVAARSLVEGLFGIHPDRLADTLTIRPGWPIQWEKAGLEIPDISIAFARKGDEDRYVIRPSRWRMKVLLRLRMSSPKLVSVKVNGVAVPWQMDGEDGIRICLPADTAYRVVVRWGRGFVSLLRKEDLVVHVERMVKPSGYSRLDTVSLRGYFNDRVTNIFKQSYLSPRPSTPTLQIPTQGIGNWCYPLVTANIDDEGLRKAAGKLNEIVLPAGIPLATPSAASMPNILFTSLWDNYPDSVCISLKGKATHAWMLMAGTTNPMQSRITNGLVRFYYKDGSFDELLLVNPKSWWPIEQDYSDDGYAFTTGDVYPIRVRLKTGELRDRPGGYVGIKGLCDRGIDGGAATVLDCPLNGMKKLDRVVVKALARDVVVGLMSLTLARK